jgi:hypothetical protein
VASNDARHFTAYAMEPIARWFLAGLAKRMGVQMEMMAQSPERRMTQARALMPSGVNDSCVVSPQRNDAGAVKPTAPRKVYEIEPAYPSDQLRSRRDAVIVFEGEITEHGTLINPNMKAPADPPEDFASAAQLAFGQWRFAPSILNGCPVRVMMTFTTQFKVD